ncbi:MAG: phosphohistidine phosphatase SixA [Pirellula sp.]|nr:phosphohistidine phosphatase SixA [Pirellula sp.]
MRLYIIRHAWAGDPGPQWPDDAKRPLTDDGKRRFRKVADVLGERGFAPRLVVTSPYVRARQTADILVDRLQPTPELHVLDALQCGSDLEAALRFTAARTESEIAWVGHMPDVATMTSALIGDHGAALDFSKGAVAALDFEGPPAVGAGVLRWFVTAKLLGC